MTFKDHQIIKKLYFVDRYPYSKIGILFGVHKTRIYNIIHGNKGTLDTTFVDTTICKMGNHDGNGIFYIDGNTENEKPNNMIWLCDSCKARVIANIERKKASQYQS